jgi:hypothetical protein
VGTIAAAATARTSRRVGVENVDIMVLHTHETRRTHFDLSDEGMDDTFVSLRGGEVFVLS